MSLKVTADVERGRALGALIAAHPSMGEGVPLKMLLLAETDATSLTAEGLLPLMDSHVTFRGYKCKLICIIIL